MKYTHRGKKAFSIGRGDNRFLFYKWGMKYVDFTRPAVQAPITMLNGKKVPKELQYLPMVEIAKQMKIKSKTLSTKLIVPNKWT